MSNPTFLTVMKSIMEFTEKFPESQLIIHDGSVSVRVFVGIENTDLMKQAKEMFEPAE